MNACRNPQLWLRFVMEDIDLTSMRFVRSRLSIPKLPPNTSTELSLEEILAMLRNDFCKLASWVCLLLAVFVEPSLAADTAEGISFFEKKIRPVLIKQCYECHSAEAGGDRRVRSVGSPPQETIDSWLHPKLGHSLFNAFWKESQKALG